MVASFSAHPSLHALPGPQGGLEARRSTKTIAVAKDSNSAPSDQLAASKRGYIILERPTKDRISRIMRTSSYIVHGTMAASIAQFRQV